MAFFSFPYWNLRRKILRPYFLGSGPLELAWWLAGLKLFISWKIRKESSVLDREGDGAHLLSPVTVFSEFVLSLWKCHWWNSEETPQSCLLFISYILNTGKLEKDCACHVYGKNKRLKTSKRAETITMNLKCRIWTGSLDEQVWIWRDSVVGVGRWPG